MGSSKISTLDLEEPVVEVLNTIDTVADQLTVVDTNIDTILTRLTDTRAGYLDYLANSTYGLSALKSAIDNVNSSVSSGSVVLRSKNYTASNNSYNSTSTKNITLGVTNDMLVGLYAIKFSMSVNGVSNSGIYRVCMDGVSHQLNGALSSTVDYNYPSVGQSGYDGGSYAYYITLDIDAGIVKVHNSNTATVLKSYSYNITYYYFA